MTRFRLAAIAALSMLVLLVPTTGGEAQKGDAAGMLMYRMTMKCKTLQDTQQDFVKAIIELLRVANKGDGRRQADSARLVPVKDAKVITKLKDLSTADGDDVVDGKDTDRTNRDGIAKTKMEFDNFGNYRLKGKAKVDGDTVAVDTVDFGVADRESGKCDPPLPAAG